MGQETPPVDPEAEEEEGEEADPAEEKTSAYYLDLLNQTCRSLDVQRSPSASQSVGPDLVSSARCPTDEPVVSVTAAAITTATTSTGREEEEQEKGVYRLKWVEYKDPANPKGPADRIALITQNENGPCPLIAIMNVLLLKRDLRLPKVMDVIRSEELMELLGDCILAHMPKNLSNGAQLNYEQNMMDAMAILPKLQTGLDVNVRFTSVTDFEFTPELIVFDLLRIPLFHGWLVDPSLEPETAKVIGSCSYNQLVDKIISHKSSERTSLVTEALMAEQFLESTATQLTYYGLHSLCSTITPDEPCVLFRNNHFITLIKNNGCLFQLVTDQGFLSEPSVVWETLSNIEGDGRFVDQEFVLVPPKQSAGPSSSSGLDFLSPDQVKQQEDQDYLLALSLQEEFTKELEQLKEWERGKTETGMTGLSDEELARRLQQQEHQQQQSSSGHSSVHPTTSTTITTQQFKNMKLQQERNERTTAATSSSHQHHPHHHHHHNQQQHHHHSSSGLGSNPPAHNIDHRHQENPAGRPSSGQSTGSGHSSGRRRTTSEGFPTRQGSHSDGNGSGGHRRESGTLPRTSDHRRNKSSVSIKYNCIFCLLVANVSFFLPANTVPAAVKHRLTVRHRVSSLHTHTHMSLTSCPRLPNTWKTHRSKSRRSL